MNSDNFPCKAASGLPGPSQLPNVSQTSLRCFTDAYLMPLGCLLMRILHQDSSHDPSPRPLLQDSSMAVLYDSSSLIPPPLCFPHDAFSTMPSPQEINPQPKCHHRISKQTLFGFSRWGYNVKSLGSGVLSLWACKCVTAHLPRRRRLLPIPKSMFNSASEGVYQMHPCCLTIKDSRCNKSMQT